MINSKKKKILLQANCKTLEGNLDICKNKNLEYAKEIATIKAKMEHYENDINELKKLSDEKQAICDKQISEHKQECLKYKIEAESLNASNKDTQEKVDMDTISIVEYICNQN